MGRGGTASPSTRNVKQWFEQRLPPWAVAALDRDPADVGARGAAADWLDENGLWPDLAGCYRLMFLKRLHPVPRLLSQNPVNLSEGWGWFSQSDARPRGVIPAALLPPKPGPAARPRPPWAARPADWAWPTFWDAERFFVSLWEAVPGEVRLSLLGAT